MKRYLTLSYQLLIVFCGLASCSSGKEFRHEEGLVWNTAFHITYESDKDLSDSILLVMDEIDNSLSPFNDGSTVSKINDNRSAEVDRHFTAVYNKSREINCITHGAFDPTLAPLIRAWGFGQGHAVSAADTLRIDSLLRLVGILKTELKGTHLVKQNPEIEFNFSALAKGYGVDCISDMLQRNGVMNFLVEVGGEIRASGSNSKGSKWGIGIDRPEVGSLPGNTVFTLYTNFGGIATSGNYRNFQQDNGALFGHTLSPLSGRPVQSDVISATVIAKECIEADALATSCMVLGSRESLALCDSLGVGLMLVLEDMSVVTNSIISQFSEHGKGALN